MERLGPRDALVVTPGAMMSFALDSGAPVRFQAAPHRDVGIVPKFDDRRIYLFMLLTKLEVARLDRVVGSADRVVVVDSGPDLPVYQQYRARLATELQRRGFEVESTTDVNRAFLNVWHRRP